MASDPRAWALRLAAGALVLAVAVSARAEPTAADRETARSLMQDGRALRDKGDLKGALDRFRGANEIMHVPTTALEVAKVQVALGQLVEARDTVAAVRQSPDRPSAPAPFREARVKLLELDSGLEGRVPSITISVHGGADADAPEIAIDGVKVPAAATRLPRSVDPGHHVVTATTAAASGKQEVDVREGQKASVDITLAPVDGASSPPSAAAASTNEEAPAEPEQPATTRSHGADSLTWIGVGLAGAGVVAGSVTGALVLSKTSQLHDQCPGHVCPASSSGSLDSTNALATVSTVSFVAAGVGAALAIVSLVVGHDAPAGSPERAPEPPSGRAGITPWIGLGAAGVNGVF